MVEIQLRKFQNQFKNGVDLDQNSSVFTHFLLGFIGQRMKRVTKVATSWKSDSSIDNPFTTSNGVNTITRQSGSWIDDGFQINDDIFYNDNSTPFNTQANTITNLTDLVMTCQDNFTFSGTTVDTTIFGTTKLRGINYLSNLIENIDPVGYISKVDNLNTKKWTGQFTVAEYDNLTLINATQSGTDDSWKMDSDSVTLQMIQLPLIGNLFIQIIEVVEIFTITPFFDNISNLEAGIKPDYLIGASSLRSIARFELLHTVLNPITKHILNDSENPDTNGNVGYYDEHANGFTPIEFTKDAIIYSNDSNEDKIVIDEVTSIVCSINSANNVLSQGNSQFQMNIVFLNEDIDNADTIDTNFAFDTVFGVADGSTKSGENGIFSNVEGNIISDQLVVTADITFSPAQQGLIEDGKYLISIATNDHTLDIESSIFVNVLMDLNDFIKNNDIPDLMVVDTSLYYEHPHDKGTQGKTDFKGWVEDGILKSTDFALDLSKGAVINNMNVRLMARNPVTNDDFEIANIPIDFASALISGGVQQIDIDGTRGFKLVSGSQFNFIKVQTMAKVGNLQHYDLDIGFKLQWMDWQALAEADPVFFDNTKINDGLNRLISNYSALNDYDIVMFIDAEVSNGVVNTTYRFMSPPLRVYEYEADDTGSPSTRWLGLTETFDQSANNLNSNIHGTENTEVKVTFTAQSGLISGVPLYAIPRLEEFRQGGLFNIFELSTFRNAAPDNPLIPKTGENKATFEGFSDRVEVEFAIDFSKLNPGSQYKISCRLGTTCNDTAAGAWATQNSTVNVLLFGVDFITDDLGIACGDGGTIVKTTDGGDNWIQQTIGTSVRLRDVFWVDSNIVYVSGNGGRVFKSIDGGDTWVNKSPTTTRAMFDLHFFSDTIGWVCGQGGEVSKTVDGGDNWVVQSIATAAFLSSIVFIDNLIGYIATGGGKIFKTVDGGTNWIEKLSGAGALEEIDFIGANGWAINFAGFVHRTTDGGDNWTPIDVTPTFFQFRSIDFSDALNGIVGASGGAIFRTTDGGLTWTQESSGTVNDFFDTKILSASIAYAVGGGGEIIKYLLDNTSCSILDSGKLKEDGTQKLTEDGDNKIQE